MGSIFADGMANSHLSLKVNLWNLIIFQVQKKNVV